LPPQSVVTTVLREYLKETGAENLDEISFYELTQFLNKHHLHLCRDDVYDFIQEVPYLANHHYTLKVDEIASLIRDDVEMFPR
jgi:hypothetical protein